MNLVPVREELRRLGFSEDDASEGDAIGLEPEGIEVFVFGETDAVQMPVDDLLVTLRAMKRKGSLDRFWRTLYAAESRCETSVL